MAESKGNVTMYAPLHIISEGDAENFVSSKPTVERIESLQKSELLLVAGVLGIRVEVEGDNKFPLVNLVRSYLCDGEPSVYSFAGREARDSDVVEESMSGRLSPNVFEQTVMQAGDNASHEWEFRKLQMQLEERKLVMRLEEKKLEKEMQIEREREQRKFQLELEEKQAERERYRIDHGVVDRLVVSSAVPGSVDSSKLVPEFDEAHVSDFFARFEKVALGAKWPRDKWSTLVRIVLKGKALRAYDVLTVEEAGDYEILKQAVLRTYELRPEAYRQRFRACRKRPHETHTEFCKALIEQFESWMRSEQVAEKYDRLKELVILENFLGKLEPELQLYLADRGVKTASQAAICADDYYLIRQQFKTRDVTKTTPNYNNSKSVNSPRPKQTGSPGFSKVSQNTHSHPHTYSHTRLSPKPQRRQVLTCTYCNRVGHTVERCWKKAGVVKPNCFVHSSTPVITSSGSPVSSSVGVAPSQNGNVVEGGVGVELGSVGESTFSGGVVQAVARGVTPDGLYAPYLFDGTVQFDGVRYPARILRDTGATVSLWVRPKNVAVGGDDYVLIKGVTGSMTVPFVSCEVGCKMFNGEARVGVLDSLPGDGVDLILGNDLVPGNELVAPVMTKTPVSDPEVLVDDGEMFPACAVTRSMARSEDNRREATADVPEVPEPVYSGNATRGETPPDDMDVPLEDTFMAKLDDDRNLCIPIDGVDVGELRKLQEEDPEIQKLRELAIENCEVEKGTCYYLKEGVLWRRWRPPHVEVDDGMWDVNQIVVPKRCREELLNLAHATPFSGHMGVRKTLERLRAEFFWPTMVADVALFVRCCHTCQIVGQPNQRPPKSPLIPIPAIHEPFSKLIVDIVGPLPPTSSGCQYLLTILDPSTRYPEAVPLRTMKAKNVVNALLQFFTKFGLPLEIQSDRGSNFCSDLFQQALTELGVKHVRSSAYHPESQGALERYHQTLKNMIRKYCLENTKDWDRGLPFLLFATREVPQESLGFSPNQLVFGHRVRGPLNVVKEAWSGDTDTSKNLLRYVTDFRTRLHETLKVARENLTMAQTKMKQWYDRKTQWREFQVGEEVLVLLPMQGQPLAAKYSGPYVVERRVGETDYLVKTPDRRKTHQLCHVNMLKKYHRPPGDFVVHHVSKCEGELVEKPEVFCEFQDSSWAENGANLQSKTSHLSSDRAVQLAALLRDHREVFASTPGRTDWAEHDVDVGDAAPIKLPPYRVSPRHIGLLRQEITYMLDNHLISPCTSEWSSPVTLQPKSDGTARFCIDYRRLNAVTRTDTYPLPRLEDCIDRVGAAEFITKVDLKKGFWQVPLTERAKAVSCFVADGQTYMCHVMPFGMKNAPATFQRLMNQVVVGLSNCVVYLDDVVVYTDTWEEHLVELGKLLKRLSQARLVANLEKCEFVQAQVLYLGYVVGRGTVSPPDAKVKAIRECDRPKNRRELRRFLGCIGYYRRFLRNFSTVVTPLTELLKKDRKFVWDDECEKSFEDAKNVLVSYPVMLAPNFEKSFVLATDASNVGAGAVLLQEDDQGVEHPVCYYSKKFSSAQRNYSVIEKELLALVLALQHFEVYVPAFGPEIKVYTDHHPLRYLEKLKTKNQRLTRWSLYLQQYALKIQHVKGVDNLFADCLSRQ